MRVVKGLLKDLKRESAIARLRYVIKHILIRSNMNYLGFKLSIVELESLSGGLIVTGKRQPITVKTQF